MVSKSNLKRHITSIHQSESAKVFECPASGKVCNQEGNLKTQMLVHSNMKNYTCDCSGKQFKRKYHLERHSHMHSKKSPIDVSIVWSCSAAAPGWLNTFAFIRGNTPINVTIALECSRCKPIWESTSWFIVVWNLSHVVYAGRDSIVWGCSFSSSTRLTEHLRIHTGVYPYQCDDCLRMFKVQANLREHQLIHSGVKLFMCGICGKGFTRSQNERSHRQTHKWASESLL